VMPIGTRIALDRERIGNLAEVESTLEHAERERALGRSPTAAERRVLLYHARRGTTSALYERLRQQYPDWSPPG